MYSSDLQYEGAFRVPNYYNSTDQMSYGGSALAYDPENNGLFITGLGQSIAEVSIPSSIVNSSNLDNLSTASVLQPWTPVLPNLPNPLSGASDGTDIGGLMVQNGQLYGTAYAYYSGANNQSTSAFVLNSTNLSTATVSGLDQVGPADMARYTAGWMVPIPSEWQASLGAPDLMGQGDIPIVSTTSSGPSAFGFNPSQLGSGAAPDTPYVYYPSGSPLGAYTGPANPIENGTTIIGGSAFIPGTSSVLFFGSTATNYAGYGEPGDYGDNVHGGKGPHSLNGQYAFQVWAYNANDFAAAAQGTTQPTQVLPYDVWNFNLPISGNYQVGGVAFNPNTNQVYVAVTNADTEAPYSSLPLIEVFQATAPSPAATPPAAPQIGTLAVTTTQPAPSGSTSPYAPGPIPAGTPAVLTAGNVYALSPGTSVSQVAFYLSANNSAPFSATNDTFLGYGTGTNNLPNGASTDWSMTMPAASTTGLTSGNYTIWAVATQSDGQVSVPISTTLQIA
jgi:hypothetical protein